MKITEYKSNDIKEKFTQYLKDMGYSEFTPKGTPSTVYDYLGRIDYVIYYEQFMDWFDVIENIEQLLQDYSRHGIKEDIGSKSNNAVISALRRFNEFLVYLEAKEDIKYSYLVKEAIKPTTIKNNINKSSESANITLDDTIKIGDTIVWIDLADNSIIKRQISPYEESDDEHISYKSELAQKSLYNKQGIKVNVNEFEYLIKEVIKHKE